MVKINTHRKVEFKNNEEEEDQAILERPRFISLENGKPERETK